MPKRSLVGHAVALAVLAAASPMAAQDSAPFEYVVKFVCGPSRGEVVAPGQYFTAINVHNPGREPIEIHKHFSIALPSEKPGPVSEVFRAKLGPEESFEVDCPDIVRHVRQPQPFLKGFAIIESRVELDIVAVYTAAGATRQIETMDIERVPARHRGAGPGCPDLTVESIDRPEFDATKRGSIIRAVIRNVGTAAAGPTTARVVDPSTLQPSGAPENAIAATPALAPGASVTVTFFLTYWVFNPDAVLDVTGDYKNELTECDETNNTKHFEAVG